MKFRIESPYKSTGDMEWYMGCLHSHSLTRNLRPHYPPKYTVPFMKDLGFDFIFITDHDYRIKAHRWDEEDWYCSSSGFIIARGFELSHSWGHIGILGFMPDENEMKNLDDEITGRLFDSGYPIIIRAPGCSRLLSLNDPYYAKE